MVISAATVGTISKIAPYLRSPVLEETGYDILPAFGKDGREMLREKASDPETYLHPYGYLHTGGLSTLFEDGGIFAKKPDSRTSKDLHKLFQHYLGRDPTAEERGNWIDQSNGRIWGGLWDKRDELLSAQATAEKGGGSPSSGSSSGSEERVSAPSVGSSLNDLQSTLDFIGQQPLANAEAEFPPEELARIRASMDRTRDLSDKLISGEMDPFTTSPEQRQRLIDRAEGDFGRQLAKSEEQIFERSSERGLFPTGQTGFSGPTAESLSEARTSQYEDPLTSFIRDFDIQEESSRVSRQRQLRDVGFEISQLPAQQAFSLGQSLANIDLSNIAGQRNFLTSMLGGAQNQQRIGLAGSQFERNQFESDRNFQFQLDQFLANQGFQQQSLDFARDSQQTVRDDKTDARNQQLIGAGLGGLIGYFTGDTTGWAGALQGAGAGSSIGGQGGGLDLSSLFSSNKPTYSGPDFIPIQGGEMSGFKDFDSSKFQASPFESGVSLNSSVAPKSQFGRRVI